MDTIEIICLSSAVTIAIIFAINVISDTINFIKSNYRDINQDEHDLFI